MVIGKSLRGDARMIRQSVKRFGDKIMRSSIIWERDRTKPGSTFADRAVGKIESRGAC
jgi:hypothetical protein